MANPVVHWEIGVKDAKKANEFYGKLFDWQIDSNSMPNYGVVPTNGQGGIGGGISAMGGGEMPAYVTFYVQVDDLQAYLDKAESLGGTTVIGPTPIPGVGAFAWFKDPDGNHIGLFKG